MRRRGPALLLAVAACGGWSATAAAHPLGNFSVNHLTQVRVSAASIDLFYILDQAEIPTFQERGQPDTRILAIKQDEVLAHLEVTAGADIVGNHNAGYGVYTK